MMILDGLWRQRELSDLILVELLFFNTIAESMKNSEETATLGIFAKPASVDQLVDRVIAEKAWRQLFAVMKASVAEIDVTDENERRSHIACASTLK